MVEPRGNGQGGRAFGTFLTFLALFGPLTWPGRVVADTVVLRGGRTVVNVVTVPTDGGTLLVYRSGRIRKVPATEVLTIRIGAVNWPPGLTQADVRRLVDEQVALYRRAHPEQPAPVASKDTTDADHAHASKSGVLWRSVVLPGWGQFSAGEKPRGLIFLAATLSAGFGLFHFSGAREAADADFRRATQLGALSNLFGAGALPLAALAYQNGRDAEVRAGQATRNGNVSLALLAAAYGWNVLDAGYIGGVWQAGIRNDRDGKPGSIWIGLLWKL